MAVYGLPYSPDSNVAAQVAVTQSLWSTSNKNLATDWGGVSLDIHEGAYVARLVTGTDPVEVEAYENLRYDCFVERLGWVKDHPSRPGRESDRYDPYCYHLAVFNRESLVAYMRVLPWQEYPGLMLQREFRDLLTETSARELARSGVVEISRFAVAPSVGGQSKIVGLVIELLFKLFYTLSKKMQWQNSYIVLEEPWLRVLNRRFHIPFAALGASRIYPDGTKTLAAHTTITAMELHMLQKAPDKYHWYRDQLEGD